MNPPITIAGFGRGAIYRVIVYQGTGILKEETPTLVIESRR